MDNYTLKLNQGLVLGLITVKSMQAVKNGAALKSLGEKKL